ncbi:unnamed protein product [Urochloa humidicola]
MRRARRLARGLGAGGGRGAGRGGGVAGLQLERSSEAGLNIRARGSRRRLLLTPLPALASCVAGGYLANLSIMT